MGEWWGRVGCHGSQPRGLSGEQVRELGRRIWVIARLRRLGIRIEGFGLSKGVR